MEPYPVSLVQQCDIIRIHWEWISWLSLDRGVPRLLPAVQAYLFSLVTLVVILPRNVCTCQLSTSVLPHARPAEWKWWTASRKMKMLNKFLFSSVSAFPGLYFFMPSAHEGWSNPKHLSCFCHVTVTHSGGISELLLPGGGEDRDPMGEEIIATFWWQKYSSQ